MVSKFKMAASDLVSVRGQVMEYTYIPTGIKREMVRSGVDCHWKRQVIGTVGRRPVAIDYTYIPTGIKRKMVRSGVD